MAANLEPLDVDVPARVELGLLRRPEVEADAAVDPAEVIDAGALLVSLVEEIHAAVLARGGTVNCRSCDGVALRDHRGVERTGGIHHVDHATAHGAGLLHERNSLGTAAHLDREFALAGFI